MSDIELFVRRGVEVGARRSRWLGPVLAVAMLSLVAVVSYQPPSTEVGFDPRSTGDTGLAGIVDVLEGLDIDVRVSGTLAGAADADVVLVPPLGWLDDEVLALAMDGRRVVAVIAPDEDATPSAVTIGGIGLIDRAVDCPLLPDVELLRSVEWSGWVQESGPVASDADRCVVDDRAAWLTRVDVGDGELFALGTMAPLINARLFDSDADVAAVRLLAPTGRERVVVLAQPQRPDELTLVDLVDRRWFDAAWLSLAVLVLLAMSRGRRLGAPVREQLPVRVPSGELARAIGDLRHRAGHDAASAATLRTRTLSAVGARLGLPPGADAGDVERALARSGQRLTDDEQRVLHGPLAADPDQLVAHARALAGLRVRIGGLGALSRQPDRDSDDVRSTLSSTPDILIRTDDPQDHA